MESSKNSPTPISSATETSNKNSSEYKSYKIHHLTEYTYSQPVQKSSHLLKLKPVEDNFQKLVQFKLDLSIGGKQIPYEDVFGNEVIQLELEDPYTSLKIAMTSEIRVHDFSSNDFLTLIPETFIPLVWMPWQKQMMHPYLLPPELPQYQLKELTRFAMSFVEKGNSNVIEVLKKMSDQIHQDYLYIQGETTVKTTPFEFYSSKKGVCQDFANLFICLARLLNIPARYRVGYIYTGTKEESKISSEASHAWAELYLPHMGWKGFDPTSGSLVGQDHIRMTCGRNYMDAAPVTGTLFQGGGNEILNVSVKVVCSGQTQ